MLVRDIPVAAFIAWLREVVPSTAVGDSPTHIYVPSYTHPLAMWLSAYLGDLSGVFLNQDNQLVVLTDYQSGPSEVQRLPVWATRFYAQTCAGRGSFTAGDCLWYLRAVLYEAA